MHDDDVGSRKGSHDPPDNPLEERSGAGSLGGKGIGSTKAVQRSVSSNSANNGVGKGQKTQKISTKGYYDPLMSDDPVLSGKETTKNGTTTSSDSETKTVTNSTTANLASKQANNDRNESNSVSMSTESNNSVAHNPVPVSDTLSAAPAQLQSLTDSTDSPHDGSVSPIKLYP